ncbi:hypothetical protein ACROYT_G043227 [Oculina patagonica]
MQMASQARQMRLHSVTEQNMAGNLKLYFRVALLALLLPLASGDCVDLDLGMENNTIPDNKITASSVQSANTPAKNGRLNFASGSSWCAATSDTNPYLQIDLQTLHIICAVSTQGNSQADEWVMNYTLKFSTDGSAWTDYKEGGLVKYLEGNNDKNSEVKHALYGVLTRFLRFLPKTHKGSACMRTEVFGVKQKPVNLALGKPTDQSPTYINSSSASGVSGNAVDGNADTDFSNGHCSHTNAANPSWWRVDLGENLVPVADIYIVNRFSTSSTIQQRSKNYKITLVNSTKRKSKERVIFDTTKLRDPCVKEAFQLEVRNRFQVLATDDKEDIEGGWGQFKEVYNESAKVVLVVCPPEGECHCCICSEGKGSESQCPGRQAEKAKQPSRRN